ncbi:MAG TPA: M13 family metallopeptidase [Anaeromyxobacter sp.]|nr:M13 family metallopeptidase [Anaeromyxobacter sp.]
MHRFLPAVSLAILASACRHGAPSPSAAAAAAQAGGEQVPASGIDLGILDRSVDPCQDFYKFACGGWMSQFQLPPEKAAYERSGTAIAERNLALIRRIAEADAAGNFDPQDLVPQKVGDFWVACMDEEGIEKRGLTDLKQAWARIEAVSDPGSLAAEVGDLHRMGISPAFNIGSDQDARDASQMIGIIEQGGLSLPDRDYYLSDDPAKVAIRDQFRPHVARLLELAGVPAARAAAEAEAIFGLERSLAESHWTKVEMRDPVRTYNRVDLPGLERLAPRFDWARYLKALGHPDLVAFSTTTPKALERLDELVEGVPLDTWRAYLRYKLLTAMAGARALPRAFTEEAFAFSRRFTGAEQLEPRWKHCVRSSGAVSRGNTGLGEALGEAFVRRAFGPEGKARSRELVSSIEAAMRSDLGTVSWMDEPTRRKAHEKLDAMANKIGYPDRWRDYRPLRVDRSSFFRTLLSMDAFDVKRDLDKVGKPVDRGWWWMPPAIVNAYYNPSLNEMVFPAGILQPPYFGVSASDAANYGAMGMVMGHELTHGFDDEGRQYDAQGNLRDWWTPAVSQDFDHRAACVADQFDGYVEDGDIHLNGKLTLGENIADLGGIKLSLAAYRASREGKPPEPAVGGFSPDQVFFISFAQSWCEVVRPELARTWAATDPHSPNHFRVNGPLSNLPSFREAFSCKVGSPMARAERCQLW